MATVPVITGMIGSLVPDVSRARKTSQTPKTAKVVTMSTNPSGGAAVRQRQ